MKRIFTYWVNPPGGYMPAYIQLCMQTWYEHIPDLELIILNHDNLQEWIGDAIDMQRFIRLPLPAQSDVVSMVVLARHGGIFIDADTIITRDIFTEIGLLDSDRLVAFGYPDSNDIHMAVLISLKPGNRFMESAAAIAAERVNALPLIELFKYDWDYFGNDIIASLTDDEELRPLLHILNREETGNILESHYFKDLNIKEQYLVFWFGNHTVKLDDTLDKIKFGAVSLHNSWTPEWYMNKTFEEVIGSSTMLSNLLRHTLAGALNDTAAVDNNQSQKADSKIGPNDACPCGSGKKYKKCCRP